MAISHFIDPYDQERIYRERQQQKARYEFERMRDMQNAYQRNGLLNALASEQRAQGAPQEAVKAKPAPNPVLLLLENDE